MSNHGNIVKSFVNDDLECDIHTIKMNDTIYFKGKDVTDALGYVNNRRALKEHVDDDYKTTLGEIMTTSNVQFENVCQRNEKNKPSLQNQDCIV